jgi:assimilatory nitrate reductase catalytic subunit
LTATDAEDGTPITIAAQAMVESEPIVCACFGVGVEAVRSAVQSGTVRTITDIGKTLRAGSNCGSCLPELKRMLIHARAQQ